MIRHWGALEAFNYLGANARDKFAWSAQSEDRSITVLTLWDDKIQDDGTTVIANIVATPDDENWVRDPRNKRRREHLKDVWNGDRTFRTILVSPKDPNAASLSARKRWPDDTLIMTLTELNPITGEFRAKGERRAGIPMATDPWQIKRKYDPLGAYLRSQKTPEVRLTLDQIAALVGELPKAAATAQFWANARSYQVSRRNQWLEAGYRAFYEPEGNSVRFVRSNSEDTQPGEGWVDRELQSCVEAYRTLWIAQQEGRTVNKSRLRREVLKNSLPTRSETAYERRLQNISAVISELGIPPVQGYPALHNIGAVKTRLISMINEAWQRQELLEASTAETKELQTRVAAALQRMGNDLGPPPPGSRVVKRKLSSSERFVRDPNVIAWVLRAANGTCEVCRTPAPFKRLDGSPYLEVHHVRPLAQGGPDTADNAVAGCPNCHRRLHEGDDREAIRKRMIRDVSRLINYPKFELSSR